MRITKPQATMALRYPLRRGGALAIAETDWLTPRLKMLEYDRVSCWTRRGAETIFVLPQYSHWYRICGPSICISCAVTRSLFSSKLLINANFTATNPLEAGLQTAMLERNDRNIRNSTRRMGLRYFRLQSNKSSLTKFSFSHMLLFDTEAQSSRVQE